MSFITEILDNEIKTNVISQLFPRLNTKDKNILLKYVKRLLIIISLCFYFENTNKYIHQLRQNNYQDIKWLSLHLLPYLNGDTKNLTSFNDIYIKKVDDVNINNKEPEYIYSNIQYNRFIRNKNNYIEREFKLDDLDQNFKLLAKTIQVMSHKLCVNWIDILPYTINTYKDTKLYLDTLFKINNKLYHIKDDDDFMNIDLNLSHDIEQKLSGLYIGDIYNVVMNDLYSNILDIKWLIYDFQDKNGNIKPLIYYLDKFFYLSYILQEKEWNEMDSNYILFFEKKWNNIISIFFRKTKYNDDEITMNTFLTIFSSIIYNFDRHLVYYDEALTEGYIPLDDSTLDDDDNDVNIGLESIKRSLQSIKPKYIYSYIVHSVSKFKNTWFGTNLLSADKTSINMNNLLYKKGLSGDIGLTYKNVYNYMKSMIHHNVKLEFKKFSISWSSLLKEHKNIFITRLLSKNNNWFDISNNIRLSGLENIYNLTNHEINNKIFKLNKENFINIIFEVLIYKGVLTQFIPNNHKTDQSITTRDKIRSIQSDIFDITNNYWSNSYSFITMMPYNKMNKFYNNGIIENYFSFALKTGWNTAYAYDWIAQIGFCHKYINNRVIFITGATGIGKSTEIPKLFLYYSKAVDYLSAPKIICTQPRKTPTQSNAEYVSMALGVPISYKINKDSIDTNNFYVQMRHKDKKHTKKSNHGVLTYITDGSLIQEINNPIFKLQKTQNNETKYIMNNQYDAILIDEAHEHNINIDLLLTYLREPLKNNNSIKLVILSATMDDDEPRYRRYYRDINDNLKYPLNMWIKKESIDRINVDRRIHIAPPSVQTRYKITEYYEPNNSIENIVSYILSSSSIGDILIFQSGVADIDKLVTKLNLETAQDIIALPYHSKLSAENREFVENIDKNLKYLRMDKSNNYNTISNNLLTVGTNNYKRAIIVATNIAEASITISTLKYVIDIGKQKVNIYDYKNRISQLIETNISESSRMQRRGRVGRTSEGTVYYLYEQGAMKKNKTIYSISITDIFLNLYQKLKSKVNEKHIINEQYDPNNPKNILNEQIYTINNLKYKNINDILKYQYFIDDEYYNYFGLYDSYDYQNYDLKSLYYETGFDYKTLTDSNGKFYIIHPEELNLIRNINGDIVGIKEQNETKDLIYFNNNIASSKIASFWRMLFNYMYIENSYDDIIKSNFGDLINNFETDLNLNHNVIRVIFFSLIFDLEDDILKLISYYLSDNLDNILLKDKNNKIQHDNINKIVNSNDKFSDSNVILKVLNDFTNFMKSINITNNLTDEYYIKQIINYDKYNIQDIIDLFKINNDLLNPTKQIVFNDIKEYLINILRNEITKNEYEIIKWCDLRTLDYSILKTYFIDYVLLYKYFEITLQTSIKEKIRKIKIYIDNDTNLKSLLYNDKDIDLITLCFLSGYPLNVCRMINESDTYLSIYTPSINRIVKITSLSPFKNIPKTFVDKKYRMKYLLYTNLDNNTISCLHYIHPKMLQFLYNIYNKKHFESLKQITIENITQDNLIITPKSIVNFKNTINDIIIEVPPYINSISKSLMNIITYV